MDYFHLVTVFLLLLCVKLNSAQTNVTDEEAKRLEEIATLEKQKNDLYKQINKEIDESVKNLKESNDTDANIGISYINDLKKQIKELNNTDVLDTPNADIPNGIPLPDFLKSNARKMNSNKVSKGKKGKGKKAKKDKGREGKEMEGKGTKRVNYRKASDEYFKDDLYDKRNRNKKYKQRYENREGMEKTVQEWLYNRTLKKQLTASTKKKVTFQKWEKCPPMGTDKPKKDDKKGGGKKGLDKFPCCRKCCKSSYLGCLKKK